MDRIYIPTFRRADNQVTFNNGSILPVTDNDIDLGSGSYEFKDAYFDGTVTTAALAAATVVPAVSIISSMMRTSILSKSPIK